MFYKQPNRLGSSITGALVFPTLANLSVTHTCIIVRKACTAGLLPWAARGLSPTASWHFRRPISPSTGPKAIRLPARDSSLSEEAQSNVADEVKECFSVWRYRDAGDLDTVIAPEDHRGEISEFLKKAREQPLERKDPPLGPPPLICEWPSEIEGRLMPPFSIRDVIRHREGEEPIRVLRLHRSSDDLSNLGQEKNPQGFVDSSNSAGMSREEESARILRHSRPCPPCPGYWDSGPPGSGPGSSSMSSPSSTSSSVHQISIVWSAPMYSW
jgi:hypothetical protein